MDPKKDPRRNASGYMDPTAYQAIRNADREAESEIKYKRLRTTIFYICNLAGFQVESLVLKDRKTGKVWR
jgi:hypothetical protein